MAKAKYKVIKGKEDNSIMCKHGVFYLGIGYSQVKLKKLYDLGFTQFIEICQS